MSGSLVYIVYTYVQPGCKKVNTATYVHTGGVSNAYSRICTARARVHGEVAESSDGVLFIGSQLARSEQRNCVVFIGRQRNASCSSGANWLGRNSRNEAWRTAEWRKRPFVRPPTVETGSCSPRGAW